MKTINQSLYQYMTVGGEKKFSFNFTIKIWVNFSHVISPLNHELIWSGLILFFSNLFFNSLSRIFNHLLYLIVELSFIQVFHVLFMFYSSFSCFIKVFHVLFKFFMFYSSFSCLIQVSIFIYKMWTKSAYNYEKEHTIFRIKCIQVWLCAYIRIVTCWTACLTQAVKNDP